MRRTPRNTEIHMEKGPIGRTLLLFTAPVLLSQIMQQLYSIADCMIVGHFGGDYGLSAAGVAGLVLSVLVNFFIGFSTGISYITARLFGAYDYSRLKQTIQTMIWLCVFTGILFTAIGIFQADAFLIWLNCPKPVLNGAAQYLRICFLGMIPQLVSNTGTAILRSMGNTKSPLIYLAYSSLLNVLLDLALVVHFSLGLAGAAAATVVAQWGMAFLILWKLYTLDSSYRPDFRQPLLPLKELKAIIRLGSTSGLQAVFMSISSLIIQVSINQFGADAMAGMTIYAKVEGFLYYPAFSYGLALTGFIGQNLGAGCIDRIHRAMRTSVAIAVGFTLPASLLLVAGSKCILLCFTKDPGILAYGQEAIRHVLPWYFLYAVDQVYIGGLKGLGHIEYPLFCSIVCYCLFRIAWCRTLLPLWPDMRVVYYCYNFSLLLMLALLICRYYHKSIWKTSKKRPTERLEAK